METENTQQVPQEPKVEIKQVTKNPKRVEAGKKGAAARKAKQESLLNMVHRKKAELAPEEPVIAKVHKTTSKYNIFYSCNGYDCWCFSWVEIGLAI